MEGKEKMKKCILCQKKLGEKNKSGYCGRCYTKSPFYKNYQVKKQREWYAKQENKEKKRKYRQKPKVKARSKMLQKRWQNTHKERMRELRRNWERKNRRKKC